MLQSDITYCSAINNAMMPLNAVKDNENKITLLINSVTSINITNYQRVE